MSVSLSLSALAKVHFYILLSVCVGLVFGFLKILIKILIVCKTVMNFDKKIHKIVLYTHISFLFFPITCFCGFIICTCILFSIWFMYLTCAWNILLFANTKNYIKVRSFSFSLAFYLLKCFLKHKKAPVDVC